MRTPFPLVPDAFAQTAQLLSVLDSPIRLEIIALLSEGELPVHKIVDKLGKSQPLISQHLRVLKAANIVCSQRRGREKEYELADQRVIDTLIALSHLAAHLNSANQLP